MRIINPVCVFGEIKIGAFYEKFLKDLSERSSKRDTLTFCIDSIGGDVNTGAGMYDIVSMCGRKTIGIVAGRADSAAALLLQACTTRLMTRHSSLMIHGCSVSFQGTLEHAESALKKYVGLEEGIVRIFAQRCGKSKKEIRKLMARTTYFTAKEALKLALIDKIV